MANLSLVFDILARDRASQEFRKVGAAAEQTGKRTTGMGKAIGGAMRAAGAAIAAVGIGAMLKDSISLAADAEQSLGGVQAVFKGYAASVVTTSKNADQALGLSANAYRELATVIGSQLKNAGVPMDQLGKSTESLVGMGADLAAMFGGTTKEAVEALSSALKGEMDPIERYGISLNDAALKSKALELGLYSGTGALDQNAKAMAVMALVSEQGADAVGAFGREADTAAGRAARSQAQWENLRTELGNKLLPIWSALLNFLNDKLLPGLARMGAIFQENVLPIVQRVFEYVRSTVIPALQDFGSWLSRNREVILPVVAALGAMLAAFKAFMFIKTVIAAVAAFNAVLLANPIGLVIAALAALTAGLVIAYQRSETFRKIVDAAFRVVAAAGKWMWENVLRPAFSALMAYWRTVATAIKWAWDNLIKPAWDALRAVFTFLWNSVLRPAFSAMRSAWDALGRAIRSVWTGVILPVFNAFRAVGETVRRAFATAVDGIRRIWDNVKNILRRPIQAVIDVVWNNGLRKMWNVVNNLWGGNDLGAVRLARGGVMPGYTPGRDVHSFYSPTGGRLDLSGGEAVMRPEFTRAIGVANVDLLNEIARQEGEAGLRRALAGGLTDEVHQHFADGGIFAGASASGSARISTGLPGWLNAVLAFVPGGSTIKGLLQKVNGANLGGGILGSGLGSMVGGILSKLWNAAKSLFDSSATVGNVTVSSAGGFGNAVAGGGGAGGTWHSLWNYVKARVPAARINSTYRAGDPGYHGRNKAIDFGYGTGPGGLGSAGLALIERVLHDGLGRNLAEIIYDGIGNSRPNIKNGRPFAYSRGTQLQHRNHVHAAVYDSGGILPPGLTLAYNGTGRNERVVTHDQERQVVFNIYGVDFSRQGDRRKVIAEIREGLRQMERELS